MNIELRVHIFEHGEVQGKWNLGDLIPPPPEMKPQPGLCRDGSFGMFWRPGRHELRQGDAGTRKHLFNNGMEQTYLVRLPPNLRKPTDVKDGSVTARPSAPAKALSKSKSSATDCSEFICNLVSSISVLNVRLGCRKRYVHTEASVLR